MCTTLWQDTRGDHRTRAVDKEVWRDLYFRSVSSPSSTTVVQLIHSWRILRFM